MASNYGKTFEYTDPDHGGKCSKTWVYNRTSDTMVITSKYGEGDYGYGAKQEAYEETLCISCAEAYALWEVMNDWKKE